MSGGVFGKEETAAAISALEMAEYKLHAAVRIVAQLSQGGTPLPKDMTEDMLKTWKDVVTYFTLLKRLQHSLEDE